MLAAEVARVLQAKAKAAFEDETWEARRELESGGGDRYENLE